jgi:hypothetical protein
MTAFEVIFALVTVLTSLAIAHLLGGLAALLREAGRVRFSALHGLWLWTAFGFVIGNWAGFWEMRGVESWPAWAVLLIVLVLSIQYLFCALLTPELPDEGELDLRGFHARSHSGYLLALIALLVASQAVNFAFGGADLYAHWWRDSLLTFAILGVSVLALAFRARVVQTGAALLCAGAATYYMVITCNVVAH